MRAQPDLGAGDAALLRGLPAARALARPAISHFAVGAVARGLSGALYPGANLEFVGLRLSCSVHAEQAAVANAWIAGERGVDAVATTATPCGHCRQFLNELTNAESLRILVEGEPPAILGELLPRPFGPADLGVREHLMEPQHRALRIAGSEDDPLAAAALAAAERSYAPYSGTFAGIALQLADGSVTVGRTAENAAYNPGLPPLEAALAGIAARRAPFDAIRRAVLVEAAGPVSYRMTTEALLATIAPAAELVCARAVRSS